MNPIDDQLNRLFRAARRTQGQAGELALPFGLETRAMAAWRESAWAHGFWDMGVLAKGLVVAMVIMGASLWPVLHKTATSDPLSEYLQASDTTLASDETP